MDSKSIHRHDCVAGCVAKRLKLRSSQNSDQIIGRNNNRGKARSAKCDPRFALIRHTVNNRLNNPMNYVIILIAE